MWKNYHKMKLSIGRWQEKPSNLQYGSVVCYTEAFGDG